MLAYTPKMLKQITSYYFFFIPSSSSCSKKIWNFLFLRLIFRTHLSLSVSHAVFVDALKMKETRSCGLSVMRAQSKCVFDHVSSGALHRKTERTYDGGNGGASFNCGVINQINGKFKYTILCIQFMIHLFSSLGTAAVAAATWLIIIVWCEYTHTQTQARFVHTSQFKNDTKMN